MKLMKLVMLGGMAIAGSGLARADIQYTGSTSGAFTTAVPGLSFAGSGFSALVPVGGGASLSNLGTFTLSPTCTGQNCTQTFSTGFTLTFTFAVPTVGGAQQFSASVNGSAKRSGKSSNFNASANIDFDNTAQTFSYTNTTGTGTFDLSVNDATLALSGATSGTATIAGQIANLTFAPNTASVAATPEPASIAMLGVVLGLAGFGLRRHIKA